MNQRRHSEAVRGWTGFPPRLAGDQLVGGRPADWLGRPSISEVTRQSTRDKFTCWWINHLQAAAQVGGASETRCFLRGLTSPRIMGVFGFFYFLILLILFFRFLSARLLYAAC